MPVVSGSLPAVIGQVQPAVMAATSYSDAIRTELTNFVMLAFLQLQLEPVDVLCTSGSGNAMTFPELNTTILTWAAFFLVVGGLIVLVLFGGASWAISKLKSGHGGGEGKGAALAGGGMVVIGIISGVLPQISGEAWSGAEACFAMIEPVALALI